VIVTTVAAATASAGLVILTDLAERIEPIDEIGAEEVPEPESGGPYTLLLLGSDRRPTLPDERSDTTILLRLDPGRDLISLLSFPRDLLVSIPGHGYDKINAAYSEGGPRLTLRTVRALTGLEVNGVVDADFQGFAAGVDAIDCVYVDVDREYFAAAGAGFAEIDINAGYQRLCGLKALQYVRYRHTDNDVVRAARQQAFLREARQRVGVREVVFGGSGAGLLDAFIDNTRSTISGGDGLRRIARSIFDLRGATVNEVRIVGDLGKEDVRASYREVDRAVDRFLSGPPEPAAADVAAASADRPGSEVARRRRQAQRAVESLPASHPQFGRYAATAARRLRMPTFYPTRLPAGSAFSRDSRTYDYEDEDGDRQRAYKLVIADPHPQIVTEYYGLMGTTWSDPPILRDPSEVREIGGREYLLFYAGEKLRLVGWRQSGNSYWLSNSLLASLSEREMLGVAASIADA
jgi:LCP family protein required for cell wall assembly